MTDEELKEMIYEANKTDKDGAVDKDQFMSILQNTAGNWLKLFSYLYCLKLNFNYIYNK